MICEINGYTYRIPFEMVTVAPDQATDILNAWVHLYPRGQAVMISARVDLARNRLSAQLTADRLNLLRFADLFKPVAGLRVAGVAELDVSAGAAAVDLTVSGRSEDITAAYRLQVPDVHITSGSVNLLFPHLVLTGETTIDGNRNGNSTSTIALKLSGGKLTADAVRMQVANLAAGCRLQIDGAGARRTNGYVKFDGVNLTDTRNNIRLANMRGDIPLRYPAAASAKPGRVEIEAVRYQDRPVGSIKAGIHQTAAGLAFSIKKAGSVML